MTPEEAQKILNVMLTADGGCNHCVYDQFSGFVKAFPEFHDLARLAYDERFSPDFNERLMRELFDESRS